MIPLQLIDSYSNRTRSLKPKAQNGSTSLKSIIRFLPREEITEAQRLLRSMIIMNITRKLHGKMEGNIL